MGVKITCSQALIDVIAAFPVAGLPVEEFEQYKRESIEYDDIPAPAIHVQLQHPAHIDTIGRDKLAERPVGARAEELHHVHIWQEGCCREDENGLFVQWASTSDSYIVYSYFVDKDRDHHFYVIDYCRDEAHALIEDAKQVGDWTRQAQAFRLQNNLTHYRRFKPTQSQTSLRRGFLCPEEKWQKNTTPTIISPCRYRMATDSSRSAR